MTVETSTGVLFAISAGPPATEDAAGFGALVYTTVGEVTDIAEIGADTSVVTHEPLATGITEKFKGFTNFGSYTITCGRDFTDAGQAVLKTGSAVGNNIKHSTQVTLQSGKLLFFTNKVFNFKTTPGSANAIVGLNVSLEIESDVVEV